MLGNDTTQRLKSIKAYAEEVMLTMGLGSLQEAYQLMAADKTQQALEVVEKIEHRTKKNTQAELRAYSALASTLKSNMADSD